MKTLKTSKWKAILGTKDQFAKVEIGSVSLDLKSLGLSKKFWEEENLIAEIIADAGNAYQESPILPSQMLIELKEVKEQRDLFLECLRKATELIRGTYPMIKSGVLLNDFEVEIYFSGLQEFPFYKMINKISDNKNFADMIESEMKFKAKAEKSNV